MEDSKKLDEILKNTRQTNMLLQTVGMFINSCLFGVIAVVTIKLLTRK